MRPTNVLFSRQPRVKYQEYWRLVKEKPDGPSETYHCSYLVDWINVTAQNFRGIMQNSDLSFEETRLAWNQSVTCEQLKSQMKGLFTAKNLNKVVCFGLGDMYRKPPDWWLRQQCSSDPNLVAQFGRDSMVQHSIALTLADVCRSSTGKEVELLAQDPDYTEQAEALLKENGFSIVGKFGAGGFAEIDENSVVFSAWIGAPLKQIIADIARPVLIITTAFGAFNDSE